MPTRYFVLGPVMGADIDLHDMENELQELLNHSINDYSKIARIERAKVLLYTTNESATQIANRLHFCSGSYFAREFKKFTGQTPAEYCAENTK